MRINFDSPWIHLGIKLTNILILNFWFVIGCLPVITIGASLSAAFSAALHMAEDGSDYSITAQFWKAYKNNLGRGILYTVLAGAIAYCLWINFQLFTKLESAPVMALVCGILGILLLYIHFLCAFALEARYDNGFFMTLINSRKICMRFFLKTLALTGILVVQAMLFFGTSSFLTYVGLFCAPAVMIYTIARMAMPIFRTLEKDNMATDGFSVTGA